MAFKMKKATIYKLVDEEKTKLKLKMKNTKKEMDNKQKDDVVKKINTDVYDEKSILLNNDGEREF